MAPAPAPQSPSRWGPCWATGGLSSYEAASHHSYLNPCKQWWTQRARHPSEIWHGCVIMMEWVYVCDIYFTINHLLCLFDTCRCLLSTIITIDWKETHAVIAHKRLFTVRKVQVVPNCFQEWNKAKSAPANEFLKHVSNSLLLLLLFQIVGIYWGIIRGSF